MIDILLIAAAYLVGSVSSAIVVCRMMGLPDPRCEGSGNPGATNVLRVGGKKPAAITLAGDMLKGLLPVLAGQALGVSPLALGLIGAAAFLGHLYPVFFGFRGGKGVATLLGVLFGYHWAVGAATAATWLLVAKGFRISSLAALVATALAPLYLWIVLGPRWDLIGITTAMVVLLFWRHRSNIQRLLSGEESLIGKKG